MATGPAATALVEIAREAEISLVADGQAAIALVGGIDLAAAGSVQRIVPTIGPTGITGTVGLTIVGITLMTIGAITGAIIGTDAIGGITTIGITVIQRMSTGGDGLRGMR